jgi:hypothetical protein
VFAGRNGAFTLYEDAGDGLAYRRGAFSRARLRWSDARRRLTIGAARGRFPGRVRSRAYRVRLAGVGRPRRVLAGGRVLRARRRGAGWSYDRARRTLVVRTRPASTSRSLTIRLERRGRGSARGR